MKSITINNCNSLTGISNSNNTFSIISCDESTTLDISNNYNLTHLYISFGKENKIEFFNINNTNLYNIKMRESDSIVGNHFDISNWKQLMSFYITNNNIEEIYLPNIKENQYCFIVQFKIVQILRESMDIYV